jgi:phenylpropionate dioxygenase-like ring-hydroxylating dioxygenase large terminal subunit
MHDHLAAKPVVWSARTNQIPKEVMVREDLYERERERIFLGPEWHPVAHVGELPNKGDFKTLSFAGLPLLVTRDTDDRIHVHYNSCSHRGTQLETAFRGNRNNFECPYHRWVFGADGQLKSCPKRGEGYCPDFRKEDFPLTKVRTELFYGMVFVTFSSEAPGLADYLENLAPTLQAILCGDGRLSLIGYQKVRFQSNWKGYNDSDGYHAPLLHGAFRVLNWQGGKGTQIATPSRGHIGATSEISLPADGGRSLLQDPTLIEFKGGDTKNGSHVVKMFPLFVGVKHLDVVNLRFATPCGVDQTEVHYAYFAHQDDSPEMRTHRIRQASNFLGPSGFVSLEDAAVFQRIHIGNGSPGFANFQKGVTDPYALPDAYHQNEESSNLAKWEYYRKTMGFERQGR